MPRGGYQRGRLRPGFLALSWELNVPGRDYWIIGRRLRVICSMPAMPDSLRRRSPRSCRWPPRTTEAARRRTPPMGSGATLIIGFDSEYQRVGPKRNDVVCLAFSALDPETGKLEAATIPVLGGADRRGRPTAAAALARVLGTARRAGVITRPYVRP